MADASLIYGSGDPLWNPQDNPNRPPPQLAQTFGGFNAGNVFDSWDLNPLSQQTGTARDTLAQQRDSFLKPLFDQFRGQTKADLGDQELYNDPRFRTFAQTGQAPSLAPNQFDDPYTNQLESIAKAQMGQVRNNPGFNQLTEFLNSQFKELSTAPGFSPAEMSVLNTQASEPIEELRRTSSDRALQRTSNRGMLPTSGLAQLDQRNVDQFYDKLRTQANRDLAINAIDRRDSDLNRAGTIASQLGLTIPQGQRSEELGLAQLLYGLPRNALMDALAVVNGSPSSADLLSGANAQANQSYIQQQQNQQRWAAIAQFLAGLGI
jgi:hypothetical protein